MVNVLDLAVDEWEGLATLVPSVDGTALADMVQAFEQSRGFTPAGGYAGVGPTLVAFDDIPDYYLGVARRQWPRRERVWLLGCECGEEGCWPFEAGVTLAGQSVTWSSFSQPHRRARSYAGFGPFVFDRRQYEDAVVAAVAALRAGGWGPAPDVAVSASGPARWSRWPLRRRPPHPVSPRPGPAAAPGDPHR